MFAPPSPIEAEQTAHEVATSLPSPYCPGRSIASCPSSLARALEVEIVDMASAGKSAPEIEEILVQRFGEEKMGEAQSLEVGMTLLIVASIVIAVILWAARRWRRQATREEEIRQGNHEASGASSMSVADADRLADALEELEDEPR